MRFSTFLALPALAAALPSYNTAAEERSLLGSLLGDVDSLLGSVASSIDPNNKRPEPGYEFIAPGKSDSRGPCPGLNLLANYGYLPRDGHVSFSQVVEAVARGFNMGADLAVVLATFAILTDGDPVTETWYLGAGPGNVGGLNRHSTIEVDISPNKEDFYLGCGDNHHISSRMFEQNVKFAAQDGNKEFNYAVMARQYVSSVMCGKIRTWELTNQRYGANSRFSQQYNPYIYYFPFPSIVSVVAFNFYPEYFSNGTFGLGGVANIIGAKLNKKTGHFEYVPERWPENWYRRATPYGAVQALTDGFTSIYPANPVPMPIAQVGTPNLNVTTILCDVYQGLNSVQPLALAGLTEAVESDISWALGKLADVGLSDTDLGCPTSTISTNFLYGNMTTEGGPLGPPPNVYANTGNNVYNKTYFCSAPETPICSHTC
nr:aromatic peroxygenase [Quercus suber]